MSMEMYELILNLLKIFICVVVAVLLIMLGKKDIKGKARKLYSESRDKYYRKHTCSIERLSAYQTAERKLLSTGIKFRMGKQFGPFEYMVFRILVCAGLGLVGVIIGPVYMAAGVVLGFVFVPFYFNYENGYDNNEMLDDIRELYATVALHTKNGVFISDSIYECYLNCRNRRLKEALLELSTDISTFGNIREAAESFSGKFTNNYIDAFAKTLIQARETGNSIQLFEDIRSSIKGIDEALNVLKEGKVKRVSFYWQTAVFICIILGVMYIVSLMFGEVTAFI